MVDRVRPLFRGLEVRRGVDVQPHNLGLGSVGDEPSLEKVSKQVVVSIPLVIQAVCKQAAILELCEGSPAVVDASEALGDLRRDLLQDRVVRRKFRVSSGC